MLFRFKTFSRIFVALSILAAIVVIGSLGYMFIAGYEPVDAFYMTVITISTVGFREVVELDNAGKIFTAVLIMGSIGTFAYVISAITTYFVAGEYKDLFKRAKVERELNNLNDHVIVCGYGRVGIKAVSELSDHGKDVAIIENSEEKILHIENNTEFSGLFGNATADENLIKAGIERAQALITTLPDDAQNLYVVLTARELNKNLTIISRASNRESVRKLRIAGADNVIMPDSVGGAHMASLVVNPDVIDFLDHIRIQGGAEINLEEVCAKDLPQDFQYKTLGDLEKQNRIGINIIGFKTTSSEYIINPGPETRIEPNSKLFVLGNPDQIRLLNRIFGINPNTK